MVRWLESFHHGTEIPRERVRAAPWRRKVRVSYNEQALQHRRGEGLRVRVPRKGRAGGGDAHLRILHCKSHFAVASRWQMRQDGRLRASARGGRRAHDRLMIMSCCYNVGKRYLFRLPWTMENGSILPGREDLNTTVREDLNITCEGAFKYYL